LVLIAMTMMPVLLLVMVSSTMLVILTLLLRVLILFVMLRSLLVVRSLGARRTRVEMVADTTLRIDRVLPVLAAVIAVVDAFRASRSADGMATVFSVGAIGVRSAVAAVRHGCRRRRRRRWLVVCLDPQQSVLLLAAWQPAPLLKYRENTVVVPLCL